MEKPLDTPEPLPSFQGNGQPDSMLPRFTGGRGEQLLRDALCGQILVRGETEIAEELRKSIELVELKAGEILIEQEGVDNDIFFIVSGELDIQVNKRSIATRTSGTHVGEMALIEPTSRRTATVKAR